MLLLIQFILFIYLNVFASQCFIRSGKLFQIDLQYFGKYLNYIRQNNILKNKRMDDDHDMFKIVVIGSSGTGKTNIATRYVKNQFDQSLKATVGVQFFSKISIKIALWDTAGQQKYKSLSKVYYKGSSGVLIVYDVTDPQSYLDVQSWMRLANQNLNLNEVVLMVVGNKVDLEQDRKVPAERPIRQYKDKFDIDCWQVSAKTGYNVKEVFAELIQKIYQMHMGPKGSHIPFGQSQIGDSIVQGPDSLIANKKLNQPNNQGMNRVSKQIPQVIIQQSEPHVDMTKKKKGEIIEVSQPGKNSNDKSNSKTNQSGKKDNNMKLTVKDDNKRNNKKKQKGGCC